ncbi:hypothetical protein APW79_04315 [Staphylococcus aureus]|nr:hypothetical protein APW79_04315 [Staphylococcus aureus]
MKKILFDVDGIFLSEERCFDVSALTVYELLMDKCYLGLHSHIDWETLTDNDIQDIRNRIFQKDKILNKLKQQKEQPKRQSRSERQSPGQGDRDFFR